MFETPNCRVKPTEASARIDAVTRPNPIDWTKRLPVMPSLRPQLSPRLTMSSPTARPGLLRGRNLRGVLSRHLGRAVGGDDLKRSGRVLPLIEADRSCGADVPDCLAVGERGFPLRDVVHDDSAWRGRCHLHDPWPQPDRFR